MFVFIFFSTKNQTVVAFHPTFYLNEKSNVFTEEFYSKQIDVLKFGEFDIFQKPVTRFPCAWVRKIHSCTNHTLVFWGDSVFQEELHKSRMFITDGVQMLLKSNMWYALNFFGKKVGIIFCAVDIGAENCFYKLSGIFRHHSIAPFSKTGSCAEGPHFPLGGSSFGPAGRSHPVKNSPHI